MRKQNAFLVLTLMLTFCLGLLAQESAVKGSLGGTIFDSTGAVVAKAKVTMTGPVGNKTTTSDAEGRFTFDVLTPGFYSVKVEMTGFKAVEAKQVEVYSGKTSAVRLTLEPGGTNEVIEVTAAAVGVDTSSTALGANLNDTFYQQLPVARNVTGLFYASAGVTNGGGTGSANPSIAGGSGLENQYTADGVNITDGAFGGIGVFSRVYGPLATGINLSFVKEVDVKTGGYEPQYGKSTGGIVQIVTKTGGNEYHGSLAGFYGPRQFEVQHPNPDDAGLLNQFGNANHLGAWDVAGEIGGPVPHLKDHLFFFGAFNPSWNRYYDQYPNLHGVGGFTIPADTSLNQLSYDYSAKLTWKVSNSHTIESSIFGDPTRENYGPNSIFAFPAINNTVTSSLSNGTRNWVARYNGTLSPTWLVNASFSWGHNYLTETPSAPNVYFVGDNTGAGSGASALGPDGTPLTGIFTRQGLGYYEDTHGDNYGLTFDTQKVVNKWGSHTFSVGYHYERNAYGGQVLRTGPRFTITPAMAAADGFPQIAGRTDNATFNLDPLSDFGNLTPGQSGVYANVPGYANPVEVVLQQTRGTFSSPDFDSHGRYHAAYANDSWAIGRHVTVNFGYRWEQQWMQGTPYTNAITNQPELVHYTYTDNWSPRIGLAIDPLGDRKTKIYGNFARYDYAIPLDMAIRSLSNEQDAYFNEWRPPSTGPSNGTVANLAVNPDGSLPLVLDDAHFINPQFVSFQSGEAIAKGTKMEMLQEWVYGVEHEFKHGILVDVRWQDRRLKRIVEDMSGVSPEGAFVLPQQFEIGNPSAKTDLFTNPIELTFPVGGPVPAACNVPGAAVNAAVLNSAGQNVGGACFTNGFNAAGVAVAGAPIPDGKPDGFVNPVRVYKGLEFEISKSFSNGWQWRTNYRWAELYGNYEGAFRNDNGQSDPSISSLFDFTPGDYNLLGDQFAIGPLNTDRRHTFNSFLSYTFSSTLLKNLTLGSSVRAQTGAPLNDLRAHPVYGNAGEIPIGGRGALGRTNSYGQGDLHADYLIHVKEKQNLHFGADLFNVSNQETQLRVNQFQDASFGVPNKDFLKPVGNGNIGIQPGYQRPFYARLFAKWEF